MIFEVSITRRAEKQIGKAPVHVADKLYDLGWVGQLLGLGEVRKKWPGFHDEPLHGKRRGQRSIRLTRSWRAVYVITSDGKIQFVSIEEVMNHEY